VDATPMNVPTNSLSQEETHPERQTLSGAGRMFMLVTAFLGWFCAGFLLSITSVAMQPAAVDLLTKTEQLDGVTYYELIDRSKQKPGASPSVASPLTEAEQEELQRGNILVGEWVAWLKSAFLFGAAFGGLVFGALGDRFGRTKGMGLAILTYSLMSFVG